MSHGYDRAKAIAAAQDLLKARGITEPAVSPEKLAKALGFLVQYAPLDDELSGMAFIKEGKAIIGVNALHHPNRQRFTIAHEIGHFLLHKAHIADQVHVDKDFVLKRDGVAATGTDAIEIEANAFAAELLMPAAWVRDAFKAETIIDGEIAIASIAKRFKVSTAAIQNRLMSLI